MHRNPWQLVTAVSVVIAVAWMPLLYADIFEPAFRSLDVDEKACATFRDGDETPAVIADVLTTLGLYDGEDTWSAGPVAESGKAQTFHYRVGFTEAVEIGSAMWRTGSLSYLKPDAPYPGDPAEKDHWIAVDAPPNQSGARLAALPAGTTTRALLVTDVRRRHWSRLKLLRLFASRLHNVTPSAIANAEAEYTVHPYASSPHTFAAADIVKGRGKWISAGKNKKGQNLRPPISEIDPSWFVLSWKDEQAVCGLWMDDDLLGYELYRFIGPESLNPAVGTEREWKKIRDPREEHGDGRWTSFGPVSTRGLKIVITKCSDKQAAWIAGLHVFTDLGDRPVPAFVPQKADLAPYRIPYELPDDGKVTMVINAADAGSRVRNLVALEERGRGANAEYWNLKDERGTFILPGTYKWEAITHKPLELRYQMTPYPNIVDNSPDNSPWLNGHAGPGGWMADHTAPASSCTSGDRVYFGAPCAESGVSTIECDLTGRKLWGHHSYAAWTGPARLAADKTHFYVANSAWGFAGTSNIDPTTDMIWAVDIATKKVTELARLRPTSARKRGLQGMEARGGKLYLSVDAKVSWLVNAARKADVDIEVCRPVYSRKRRERYPHEIVPDGRGDFLKLFRIQQPPPGHGQSVQTWLESTSGPGNRQHVVLAFNREVPIGSAVYPVPQEKNIRVKLSFLKKDGVWPPDPDKQSEWVPFEENGTHPWDTVPAPPNTATRALRITFVKGADDIFSQMEDAQTPTDGLDDLIDPGGAEWAPEQAEGQKSWSGKIEGMKLLRRRYVNVAPRAKIRVNSGVVEKDGSWYADRDKDRPLTPGDPGIFVLEWAEPTEVRGLALKEIDGKLTEIDVYTGPDGEEIDIAATKGWRKAAEHQQKLRDYYTGDNCNPNSRYLDGYVDLGHGIKTRAVRLRVIEQWNTKEHKPTGVRSDRGGQVLDATRCRVYGVTALQYVGGEVPVDPMTTERIEVVDAGTGRIESETYIEKPRELALDRNGQLCAISGHTIVKVDLAGGGHRPFVTDLIEPTTLAFDSADNLYVFDGAKDRKVVRVYDQDGKHVRDIGTPGGYVAGPWTGTRFGNVTSITIDGNDQLWVVECGYQPKRISLWTLGGKLKREFLGNTQYGGGGVLDPYDKRRLFYQNMEFELDWKTGATRLKSLTWLGNSRAAEVPVHINDRCYMVTRPHEGSRNEQPCGIVYIYEKGRLRRVAAVGGGNGFPPLNNPAVRKKMGDKGLTAFWFTWTDRNGDEDVQADEVTLWETENPGIGIGLFNRDLGIQAGNTRYVVKEFLPNGAPVYEARHFPKVKGRAIYKLDNGTFFRMAPMDPNVPQAGISSDGKYLWTYQTEGSGVHSLYRAKPMHPGQVVSEFSWIGHETAHAGDLGEFVVTHSNVGAWNIWTADGLLAGRIFRDIRDPKAAAWSMREHQRGLRLDDVTPGQEHFQGYFCRTFEDDKYYVVAGHNHASVVEVSGIDKFRRLRGTITVTPGGLRTAQAWELDRQNKQVYERGSVIDCFRSKNPIRIDGSSGEWELASAEIEGQARFRVTYDDNYLFLCYETSHMGPMKNTGEQWDRLFKTGASVDLQMSVNPSADDARRGPVAGDFRLLMTRTGKRFAAVIYRPVVPGTAQRDEWEVISPVFRVAFDQVKKLDDVRMACRDGDNNYCFEAAVPLKTIGLKITPDLRLRFDWGILVSGKDGNEVLRRVYWSNKATSIVADAPSEAALHPDLWGHIRFHEKDTAAPDIFDPMAGPDSDTEPDEDVTDFIDDLEEDLK